MGKERRERAREILQSALAKKREERTQFLREACKSDPTLIPEVEQLLDSYERVSDRLKSGSEPGPELGPSETSPEGQPSRIGKYDVIERVGQGAMGVVYKARDPLMRRLVGIKTISSDIASDRDLHDRFYREAQSAGTLSHKNIITIYELGEQQGQPFIAMEFLAGEDLKSKLDRRAKLTLEQRLMWMCEMCEGLGHAHEKDVIHRDIKPGNVFVNREGEIKILDFGLARLTSSVATKTGSVMGTPSYMSPEQVRGEKVDHRSDLFSAGATFYELLAFKKPFVGESIHGVFFQILEKMPPALAELNPWIPKELEAIVNRAIAKDVDERYGSAGEMLDDLRRLEAALPERKARLRTEALQALAAVEPLLRRYRALLEHESIPAIEAEQETLVLAPELLNLDPSEAPTLNEEIPTDFIGLATTISRALEQKEKLAAEIANLERAGRLVDEGITLERESDYEAALSRADIALRDLPEHPRAIALADRVSSARAERDPKWRRVRLDELMRQAKALFQAEELGRCQERLARARALDPSDDDVVALGESVARHVEERRRERERAKRADELVREARAKLTQEADPRGCLTILSEALSLQPEHSAGRELWERAQNELDRQLVLAAAETAAAAVVSATKAMNAGDLALASRELARAENEFPEHTEIPAIATQLLEAKKTRITSLLERSRDSLSREDYDACIHDATELLSIQPSHPEACALLRDARKARAPKAPSSGRAAGARARGRDWTTLIGTVLGLSLVGVVGWVVLRNDELAPEPVIEPATSSAVPTSSAAPVTTVAPTTLAPATSSMAPAASSVAPTTSALPTTTTIATTSVTSTTTAPPTTTTSLAPTTSVAPVLSPREQILGLMQQYETAYETLDVDLLGALYPSVPLAVKNSFRNFESLTLDMDPVSGPSIDRSTAGRTASAIYRIVQTIEPKVGKSTTSRHQATFQFAGVGNAWIIINVEWEQE